ncbi:MAG: hypothetical protein CVV27_06050, partial [Candidatus Melainabacteria bacterium HGW-Melainabacteria-1]
MFWKGEMIQRLSLALILALGLATATPAQAQNVSCAAFDDCLRSTLRSTVPLDKAVFASKGIQLWTKAIPVRDLYNLLMLRASALIQMHIDAANETFLDQATADYQQMLELRPDDFLPRTGLGRIAELRGQVAAAQALYTEAFQSGQFLAQMERADFRLRRKEGAGALEDLEAAVLTVVKLQALERDIHPQHL